MQASTLDKLEPSHLVGSLVLHTKVQLMQDLPVPDGILKQAGNMLSRELISLSEPFFSYVANLANFKSYQKEKGKSTNLRPPTGVDPI